ncbi:MAG: biopolymer transporter ExbD [Phycisphaerae bacterium]|nr:biopolymer transporter ExbD [Phycisphaerae bacterium]
MMELTQDITDSNLPEDDEMTHYVSERKQRAQPAAKMQPPLTPMIDVTFQLLLYFLLTSTFKPDEGQIPGSLPEKGLSAASSDPRPPIRIILRPRGANREYVLYEVDNLPAIDKQEDLYNMLESRKKSGAVTIETPVEIRPWSNVRWKHVVGAFNAAVRAKYKNIGFSSSL